MKSTASFPFIHSVVKVLKQFAKANDIELDLFSSKSINECFESYNKTASFKN